jgi:glucokinase
MILAGDIGGTKTLVGLFERGASRARPHKITSREFATLEYPGLPAILQEFVAETKAASIDSAALGVAGPVVGRAAQLTNVPWRVDADEIAKALRIPRVDLLNDLEAMAYGVTVLEASELHRLQDGEPAPDGNMAVIAAGTGLGEAFLHNVAGQLLPCPSEGGHADYPARNDREVALLRDLTARFGRAEVEHVVSGRGLVNIHRVTHPHGCAVVTDEDDPQTPALISAAAMEHRCGGCVDALSLFVDAYGAEAGNLALRGVARGGVFVGGGIAVKILPALDEGRFMNAFVAKGAFEGMLRKMSVNVVLNPEVGLVGAALRAAR